MHAIDGPMTSAGSGRAGVGRGASDPAGACSDGSQPGVCNDGNPLGVGMDASVPLGVGSARPAWSLC